MSDQFEVDTDELVEQLGEHQRLTGTEPKEESSGMTRGDLLKRGGVAAAAVSGVGALAGAARAAPAKSGAFDGTLRVITLLTKIRRGPPLPVQSPHERTSLPESAT